MQGVIFLYELLCICGLGYLIWCLGHAVGKDEMPQWELALVRTIGISAVLALGLCVYSGITWVLFNRHELVLMPEKLSYTGEVDHFVFRKTMREIPLASIRSITLVNNPESYFIRIETAGEPLQIFPAYKYSYSKNIRKNDAHFKPALDEFDGVVSRINDFIAEHKDDLRTETEEFSLGRWVVSSDENSRTRIVRKGITDYHTCIPIFIATLFLVWPCLCLWGISVHPDLLGQHFLYTILIRTTVVLATIPPVFLAAYIFRILFHRFESYSLEIDRERIVYTHKLFSRVISSKAWQTPEICRIELEKTLPKKLKFAAFFKNPELIYNTQSSLSCTLVFLGKNKMQLGAISGLYEEEAAWIKSKIAAK